MIAAEFLNGAMDKGHPLLLDGDEVYFRSARLSPHTGSVMVTVADRGGGLVSADPDELSRVEESQR